MRKRAPGHPGARFRGRIEQNGKPGRSCRCLLGARYGRSRLRPEARAPGCVLRGPRATGSIPPICPGGCRLDSPESPARLTHKKVLRQRKDLLSYRVSGQRSTSPGRLRQSAGAVRLRALCVGCLAFGCRARSGPRAEVSSNRVALPDKPAGRGRIKRSVAAPCEVPPWLIPC
jgi:hypothetical protein